MSIISFKFFALTGICVFLYYLMPKKFRWIVLLLSGLFFYVCGGIAATVMVIAIALFSFFAAIAIEKCEKGRKQKTLLAVTIVALLAVLAVVKVGGHFKTLADYLIVPTGISYFSLSIIGYILDVYWKKEPAEKNFAYYLTFILFYPKIVQGPISRHKFLSRQLIEGNVFSYDGLCFGVQLVLWGLFKKIVIADRINVFVSAVYSDLDHYAVGGLLIPAMILSALQLYFDFSGYTDMAIGIAQMYGVELEQNFNHPFFAKSAAEFWQRWHMTLSGWFKDYLFLPLSRSTFVKNTSKKMGAKYGPTARKKTMIVMCAAVVWLATGLWHGTGINYIVWGIYWGTIIIVSELMSGVFEKIRKALHIKQEAFGWKLFAMLRTALIFIVGKMISAQPSLQAVKTIILGIFTNTHAGDFQKVFELGLNKYDFVIIGIGAMLLLAVSILQERKIHIRESIAGWHPLPRWIFYSMSVSVILLLGMYGSKYDTSTFAYQFF